MTKIKYICLFQLFILINLLISDEMISKKNKSISYKLKDSITFAGVSLPLDYLDVQKRLNDIFYVLIYDRRGMIHNLLSEYDNYIPNSQKILTSYGIHKDFAYIIAAESGMKERISSNKSASGPWQFIKTSARDKNLRVDSTVDERNILSKSTHAAAKHIEELIYSSTCKEDPFLVLASYNNGLRNVEYMLKSQGVETFWDAVSNKETSDYVLRVIVLKEILENSDEYGFNTSKEEKTNIKNYKDKIETYHLSLDSKEISFSNLAKFTGISYREFYLLNPQLKHKSYKKNENIDKFSIIDIFIPSGTNKRLTDSLVNNGYIKKGNNDFFASDSIKLPNEQLVIYIIKDEKSLGEIAFRYGLSLQKILKYNKNIEIKKNKDGIKIPIIKKGQKIRIYKN